MLLASTAGGLAGAVIASGASVLTDRSSGSSIDAVGFVVPISQAKPTIDSLRGRQ
jgi:hypothetical protein